MMARSGVALLFLLPSCSHLYLPGRLMDSPFRHILHTNTVPTDAECDSIHALLRGPLKEHADLTDEIARLQSLIDAANRKRDELEEFIDAHLALMSPVRRLPDDVIRAVFLATLPTGRNPALNSDEAPLLLCRICRSWRILARTTPRLWASIHIVVPHPLKLPQLTERVTAWLEKSGTVPLDISLTYSRTSDTSSDVSSLVSQLLAVSRRWRNIHIALTSRPEFASLSSDDVPLLQSITIRETVDRTSSPDPHGPLLFLGTKSLRTIDCEDARYILDCPISWGSLTHFKAPCGISYQDAFRTLSQCPLLESCELVLYGQIGAVPPHPHISLPHLRHLSIKQNRILGGDIRFFDDMALPTLRSYHCYAAILSADAHIRSLFPSGMRDLQCLRVHGKRFTSTLLLAALADMPSLEELQISGEPCGQLDPRRRGDSQFLTHLMPTQERVAPVPCPRLRTVELAQFSEVSDDTLLEFILSRTLPARTGPNVVRLDRFTCAMTRPMQRDIRLDLERHPERPFAVSIGLKYHMARSNVYSPLEGIDGD
ncbi:F-box domain-containing protein [Mycena venus]|uniref:F-box domain-containing protein n=1 Tax=Mycena venus TaxID=2733690 RepID=A0A8H7CFH2_9AGAR|nr:F-box domain-containing protein [Mycena venus]